MAFQASLLLLFQQTPVERHFICVNKQALSQNVIPSYTTETTKIMGISSCRNQPIKEYLISFQSGLQVVYEQHRP